MHRGHKTPNKSYNHARCAIEASNTKFLADVLLSILHTPYSDVIKGRGFEQTHVGIFDTVLSRDLNNQMAFKHLSVGSTSMEQTEASYCEGRLSVISEHKNYNSSRQGRNW